jgi:hypothetical protein
MAVRIIIIGINDKYLYFLVGYLFFKSLKNKYVSSIGTPTRVIINNINKDMKYKLSILEKIYKT